MKKILIALVFSLFTSLSVFANSDFQIQLGGGISVIDLGISVDARAHSFFGEKQKFGVGGGVLYKALGALDFDITGFVGPSVKLSAGYVDFQFTAGPLLEYGVDFVKRTIPGSSISVKNSEKEFGLGVGLDAQIKILSDRKVSFVLGALGSCGLYDGFYEQVVKDYNGAGKYKTMRESNYLTQDYFNLCVYLGISLNFK